MALPEAEERQTVPTLRYDRTQSGLPKHGFERVEVVKFWPCDRNRVRCKKLPRLVIADQPRGWDRRRRVVDVPTCETLVFCVKPFLLRLDLKKGFDCYLFNKRFRLLFIDLCA